MRGDNVIKDQGLNDSFQQGVAEGMMSMYGGEEPLYAIEVAQGSTILVSKPQTAADIVETVRAYLIEMGGNDISITIRPVSKEEREKVLAEASTPNDDEVVEAELLD